MKQLCLFVLPLFLCMWLSACGAVNVKSPTNNPGGTSSTTGGTTGTGTGGGTGGTSSGGGGSASPTTAALAYVGGSNNTFYGIRVDSSSTVSTVSGSPYSLPAPAISFAAIGNLLLVSSANQGLSSGQIISYRADTNGALTQLTSTAVQSAGGISIALDSSGKFLYGTAEAFAPGQTYTSPAVFGFSVDQSSGTLASLPGSPWFLQGGMGPASTPVVTPDGTWVCVSMELARTNQGAQCYPRHADGTVVPASDVQPDVSATGINGMATTADSTHLIFTNGQQNQVISTLISSTRNESAVSSGGSFAQDVAIDPSGHWAAVTNYQSSSVAIFAIGAGDTLAPTGTPANTPGHSSQVAFSRSGTYVFVTTDAGTLVFSFNQNTGALSPLNASNPSPGGGPITTM